MGPPLDLGPRSSMIRGSLRNPPVFNFIRSSAAHFVCEINEGLAGEHTFNTLMECIQFAEGMTTLTDAPVSVLNGRTREVLQVLQ